MHRLTQYRLTVLHRRQAELRAAERAAVSALDDSVGAARGAEAIANRRLRLIAVELREVAAEIASHARILAEQARRACGGAGGGAGGARGGRGMRGR